MSVEFGADIARSREDHRKDASRLAMHRSQDGVNGHGASVLEDARFFRLLLELEIKKAQRLRYVVSVVCLRLGPTETPQEQLPKLVAEGIRGTDCVIRHNEQSLTILLVDAEPRDLPMIIRRVMSPFNGMVWRAGGGSYPSTASGASELLSQAISLEARAEKDGANLIYVAKPA